MSRALPIGPGGLPRLRAATAAAFLLLTLPGAAQQGGLLGVGADGKNPPPKSNAVGPTGPLRKDFQKPTAPKGGPEPFLTEAVDTDIDNYNKVYKQLIYPTQKKTEQPFYDIPITVNVPFEVPFDGGVTRVFFDVSIVWDEPELKARAGNEPMFDQGGRGWSVHRQGIYRLDGGRVAPESITWEVDSKQATKMIAPPDAPFPLLLNGSLPTLIDYGSPTTRVDINSHNFNAAKPPRPFTDKDGRRFVFAPNRPLVLRAVPPGWYALWFTTTPGVAFWPQQKLRPDDTLHAKIYVHYIVARRERFNGDGDYFTWDDLDYLWDGRDVKPTRPIDPKLVRAFSVEIPVVLRRDGWVLKSVEVQRIKDRRYSEDRPFDPAKKSDSTYELTYTGSASAEKNSITAMFAHREFRRENEKVPWPARPETSSTGTWDIVLPTELLDGGVSEIRAKGKIEETGFAQDYWERGKTGKGGYPPDPLLYWMGTPSAGHSKPGMPPIEAKVTRIVETDKATYLRKWGARFDDAGATKYFPANDRGLAPRPGETNRYWVYFDLFEPGNGSEQTGLRKMLYQDLGPQPVLEVVFGAWRATAYYCRKKDFHPEAEAPPVAGPTKAVDELDPFWKWYPSFSRLLGKQLMEVSKLEMEMAMLREALQGHRRAGALLMDTYLTAISGESTSDWFFGSGDTRASMSDQAITRVIRAAHQHNDLAEQNRTLIRQHGTDIHAAYQAVLAELRRVNPTYIDSHPELSKWERHYRRLLEGVELKVALALSDLGAVQQAAAKAQESAQNAETFIAIGQVQLENGDPIGAMASMTRAVQLAPDPADARQRLAAVECALIRVAMDKSRGTIAAARQAFFGYMKERGYGDRDNSAATAWVGGLHNPLSKLDTESAWAVFTTGVTGSVSGLLGRAEQEGRALDAVERDMTTAFIGGQVVLRLRMRGHTLEEISTMSTAALCAALNAGAPNAPPVSETRGRELGLAIHTAFQLPEFKALLAYHKSGDPSDLRDGLKQGYWNLKDVGNTWAEYIGDLSSPKNLVMLLLPTSIGTVGGRLQGVAYWTQEEAALLQAATRTGAADTGTMVIARLAGWDRALGWVGSTRGGEFLLDQLQKSQKYQEGLALLAQQGSLSARTASVGWSIAKVVAIMGVQGVAVEGTKELVGPGAAMAVESMLLFGSDTELLCKFLDAGRIPRAPLIGAIEKQFLPAAEKQLKQLKDVSNAVPQIEHVLQDMKKGAKAPPPQRRARPDVDPAVVANEMAPKTGPPEFSGGGPSHDGLAQPPNLGGAPRSDGGNALTPPGPGALPKGSGTAPPKGGKAVTAPIDGAAPRKGSGTLPPRNLPEDSSGLIGHDALTPPPGPAVNSHNSIPNGQPGNDCAIAEAAAEEGIEQGTNNGANLASRSLASDVEVEAEALSQKIADAKQLAEKLKSLPPGTKLPERPIAANPAPREYGPYEMPPQPAPGSTWARAEEAKFAGDFEEAEKLYLQLKSECARDALAGKPCGKHDLPMELIDDSLAQVAKLKKTGRIDPPDIDFKIKDAVVAQIKDGEVASILALGRNEIRSGASGKAFMTADKKFVVKELKIAGDLIKSETVLQQTVEAEVVMAAYKRALGLPVPGTNVKVKWTVNAAGQPVMESAEMVYRCVPGVSLEKLEPDELFLLRKQISEHEALDVVAIDYDGKTDNFMAAGGVAFRIDGGQADVRGIRMKLEGVGVDAPFTVAGIYGKDYWYANAFKNRNSGKDRAILRSSWAMHQAMTYDSAAPALNRLKRFLADPVKRKELAEELRQAYLSVYRDHPHFKTGSDAELKQLAIGSYGDRYRGRTPEEIDKLLPGPVAETLEMLEARAPAVDKAMLELNLRNGQPLAPTPKSQSGLWLPRYRESARPENIFFFPTVERIAA